MTAPTVTVLPKPETVLDVDLSAEVPCISEHCHHQPASWLLVYACGHVFTLCDPCKERNESAMLTEIYRCRVCMYPYPDWTWRRL